MELADRYARMRPDDEEAIETRIGVTSMAARLLAVTGGGDDLREADRLHKDSQRDLDRISRPYGFAYPVLRAIVRAHTKSAIGHCERAIDACEHGGDHTSAAAFGALQLHLTARSGRAATAAPHLRSLAAAALASPNTRFKCSHIFDESAVAAILSQDSAGSIEL